MNSFSPETASDVVENDAGVRTDPDCENRVQETDVIIVGAGMVGASIALGLTQALPQLRITVIDSAAESERLPQGEFDARVVALTRASQRWLMEIGAWSQIKQERVCPYTRMQVWDADGTGAVTFNSDALHQPNLGHIVENRRIIHTLQQAFLQEIQSNPSRLSWLKGEAVTQLINPQETAFESQQSAESPARGVVLASGQRVLAPLVIAADGGHSKTRTLAALPIDVWPCDQTAVVTNVRTEKPHEFTAWQRFLSTGPLAFLPLGDEHQCSIVWSLDNAAATRILSLDDGAFMQALEQAFESRLGKVLHAQARKSFPLVQRHTPSYGHNGLILVGDAAHSIHPLAGQGANLGLLDAQVLCNEVIRAHKRRLPLNDASVLRRYQRQRQHHNLLTLKAMSGFQGLFGSNHLPIRWLRNQGMNWLQKLPWVKAEIARQAMGL